MNEHVDKLFVYLANLPPGPVKDSTNLANALSAAWTSFNGHDSGGMEGYKLHKRMEGVEWHPPILNFTIERHGGTVNGSTRAELQYWTVDTSTLTADVGGGGFRQLTRAQPRLDVEPLVRELVRIITEQVASDWVTWIARGRTRIRVNTGKIIPDSFPRQTVAGRRKRLRVQLAAALAERGWQSPRANYFERSTD